MNGKLLLVGSIPLDTPQDVFEIFGVPLGKYLFAMPDGEVGPWMTVGADKFMTIERGVAEASPWTPRE